MKTFSKKLFCIQLCSIHSGSLILALVAAPWAQAQAPVVSPPIVNWSYVGHSSTFEEGYLRGVAAVAQSAGQANYLNSIAAVNLQEAARRNIENHHLYVQKYIQNQELTRQYRERYRASAPTPEQWQRITEAALPDRLTEDQLDPISGQLTWPHILRTDEYKAYRDRIDQLFSSRTPDNSGDGSPAQRELDTLIDGMKLLLKSNIHTVSLSQYSSAKWFLRSLAYEAQLPLQNQPAVAAVSAADSFQ